MGRVNWGAPNASPASGKSSGGRINWASAPQPSTPAAPNAQEQKVIKSFQAIDPKRRSVVLDTFRQRASAGDTEAARKLQILAPLASSPAPKTPDYTDRSLGAKVGRVGLAVGKFAKEAVVDPVLRGGEQVRNISNATSPNPRVRAQAGEIKPKQLVADTIVTGLNVATAGKGASILKSGETLLAKALSGARAGAVQGGVGSGATSYGRGDKASDIAKNTAIGTVAGGVIGGAVPVAGRAVTGSAKGAANLLRAGENAVTKTERVLDTPVSKLARGKVEPIQVVPEVRTTKPSEFVDAKKLTSYEDVDRGAVEAYKQSILDGNPIEPLKVLKDSKGKLGVEDGKHRLQALKELGIRDIPVEGRIAQDVGADVLPEEKAFKPSTRVQQYEESLQKTISNIERDPAYQQSLKERGGGTVISNKETFAKAKAAGPMDEAEIINAKAGDKIDTVTLVRAKATLDSAARDFTDAWKSKKLTPEELQGRIEHLSSLEAGYHVMSAEPGRATQIQASFIDEAFRRAQKLKELLEGTKGPNKQAIIDKELRDFEKAAKDANIYEEGTIHKLVSLIEEYGTAAKLTSPLTHAVNLASNSLTFPLKAAENIVSSLIGTAQGKTSVGQIKYVFGTLQGFRSATSQLAKDLKQTLDINAPDLASDGTKIERPSRIPGKLGKAVRTPFNFLQASDNFMKSLLRDSELHQRAYEKGYQEGFRGNGLAGRIAELVKNPTPEIAERAEQVAKEFTYTSDPGPITKKIASLVNAIPGGRLLVPFISTPTNIAKFQAQRHPVGILAPRNIQAFMKGSNLDKREAVARLTVGTGLATAGVMAAFNAKENITGAAPTDKGEKDLFYSEGKKPYAIKIGNRWVAYNRFSPIGMYLTQAVGVRDKLVDIQKKAENKGKTVSPGDVGSLFVALGTSTAKGLTDLPFVSGVSGVIEMLSDPSEINSNRVVGGVLTGLIPNISRDIASAGDEFSRNAKSIPEQIQNMIPGQRNKLPLRIDPFGEPQRQSGGPIERGFVKITSTDRTNKLTQALNEAKFYPDPPKTEQRGKELTKEQYERFQIESGRKFATKLEKALNDASYKNATEDRKQRTLQQALLDARTETLDDILGKKPKTTAKSEKVKRY